jgi:hypothetical protein
MSSKEYNLNEQAGEDYFEFILGSFKYKMRYPSSQDLLNLKNDKDESESKYIDWCAKYVDPVDPKAPDFKKTLLNKSMKYLLAFTAMIKTELGNEN